MTGGPLSVSIKSVSLSSQRRAECPYITRGGIDKRKLSFGYDTVINETKRDNLPLLKDYRNGLDWCEDSSLKRV